MKNTTPPANKYAGTCAICGEKVAAGAGTLGPKVDGKWTTRCAAHSAAAIEAAYLKAYGPRRNTDDGHDAYKDARCVAGTWQYRNGRRGY